ncbi:hypothetical protein HBI56_143460 [Parastagonospora nodorum]|uniref:F-box domain-containing protein n=1 Tax=Phaeosphaeria nodorum (strain SN15 / ATCC MYA-4574 / FGSC 10173) TaxID=321614 RepID=A0A7U2F7M3_PHANO|nr:hypothetical protein HBH56_033590 [Parastagonospora nodorum]QRD00225.1 hypothetical protein JI435_071120 [Parastagonospora nodorum SN15]KAH3933827.1 hypothetical protein HBH54_065840 [Parastagonospora nodorum]KAH3952534.1 hypothetical protein HBH53_044200 [Parastagonospora nodorum]KAH3979750.1 hypothetical protein HBH51_055230 [Parastagonospora nodorum]
MARDPPSQSAAFNALPIELNQAIARELDTDQDIARYAFVCRSTNNAVNADKGSFWRAKFREKYAFKEGRSNTELRSIYQVRSKHLRRGVVYPFYRGHNRREVDAILVLKDLIVESFQGSFGIDEFGRPRCKNHTVLRNFVLDSKILLNGRRAPPARNEPDSVHPMLAAVKLMCSHFLFELEDANHQVFALEESQRVVYMATNKAPLYSGPSLSEINMDWVLHCLNFFRDHMMNEAAATLYDAVSELSPMQKPSAWQEPLRNGSYTLGSHWKGTYSFLDVPEITKLRKMSSDEDAEAFFCDKNVDEGKIQSLQLDFVEGAQLRWPNIFEKRLHSLRNTVEPQGRAKPKGEPGSENVQFTGTGVDLEDDFNAIGWLNPLPPQHGIPGWQRITFMKHFMDDFDQVEQDNLWAYEGVVLPGGRIILGRWWYASENVDFNNDYNGPFILWAVDEPDLEEEEEGEGSSES